MMKRLLIFLACFIAVTALNAQTLIDGPSTIRVCNSGDTITVLKDNITGINPLRGAARLSYIDEDKAKRVDINPTTFSFTTVYNLINRLRIMAGEEYDSTAYIYTDGGALDTVKYLHGSTLLWGIDYTHNDTDDTITGRNIIIP